MDEKNVFHRPHGGRMGRKYLRLLFATVTLGLLFCLLHARSLPQISTPPQQKYFKEIDSYPRQFAKFVSTIAKLPSQKGSHPNLLDDPRLSSPSPKIYRPYPEYESPEWKKNHRGTFKPCIGPRGKLLTQSLDDQVSAYAGIPKGFPNTLFGSHEAVGWDGEISFDRYTRYGAYGLGENDKVDNWVTPSKVDWANVNWGKLQEKCAASNADRFDTKAVHAIEAEPRTVVLIRTYTGKQYSENDIINIRAMITELALQSGGQYEVIMLVHVRDDLIDIEHERQRLLEENVPREFWGITRFWSMPSEAAGYPELNPELMNVHHSQWLPIQQFMKENPQFEYVWNWEVDSRFTGHYYEFAENTAKFGQAQPRRGIWERSERFYIPSYHGDYKHFRSFVDRQDPLGVWGAMPLWAMKEGESKEMIRDPPVIQRRGPAPPVSVATQDKNFQWGVGEEPDLMTFLPIFNPANTDWVIRKHVFGYMGSETPRRAALITHCRLSRRLLMAMDEENHAGRHMAAELFHVSTALLHGFKALTVPHPVYADRVMSGKRVSRWYNSGVNGRSGNTPDSPFSWGREGRFKDVSWYYRTNLPGRLYWNFLGWERGGTGGPEYEKTHGRHCLPSMLLHPIKDVSPESESMNYEFDADMGGLADPDNMSHLQ